MLPAYVLVVDIFAEEETSEQQFRELIEPYLSCLTSLKVSFGRGSHTTVYYPPGESPYGDEPVWAARTLVSLSVGKARAEGLILLYQALVRLITLELPDLKVAAQIDEFRF